MILLQGDLMNQEVTSGPPLYTAKRDYYEEEYYKGIFNPSKRIAFECTK